MPVNEILAPFYSILHYTVTATVRSHVARIYLDEVPTLNTSTNEYVFAGYTDASHTGGWTLREIWGEYVSRFNTTIGGNVLPAWTTGDVELWESASGVNTFMGLDPDDYSTLTGGSTTVHPSGYLMAVFKTSLRRQWRSTFFDIGTAEPQRTPIPSVPATDDGELGWFVTKSAVKFTNQDGIPLTIASSYNTGYNRKLARSYGRFIAP